MDARDARSTFAKVIGAFSVACVIGWCALAPQARAEAEGRAPRVEATTDLSDADRTRLTLLRDTPPARNEITLARQFRGNACTDPVPTPVPMWQSAVVGERRVFKVLDERRRVYIDAQATLKAASDHL
jgi:hypothetical protein